jgi:hypothetical protein
MTTTTKKKKCTAKTSKLKNNNVVHNFFTVRDKKNQSKKYDIFKMYKGSTAKHCSPITENFGVGRYKVKNFILQFDNSTGLEQYNFILK